MNKTVTESVPRRLNLGCGEEVKPRERHSINMSEKTGTYYTCEECGDEFYVRKSREKQAERRGHTIRYCSNDCYNQNRSGENNPMHGESHSEESKRKMRENDNRNSFAEGDQNVNYDSWDEAREAKIERFHELYENGLNDVQIAGELDLASGTIWRWRNKRDMKPNHGPYKDNPSNYRPKRDNLIEEIGECERCGWNEDAEILQVHHLDGDNSNNKRGNLRLLCPNCHRTTHKEEGTGPYS